MTCRSRPTPVDDMIGEVAWTRLVERESDCFSLPLAITDSLLYEVPIGLWREDCLAVMCCSLPACQPVRRRLGPHRTRRAPWECSHPGSAGCPIALCVRFRRRYS